MRARRWSATPPLLAARRDVPYAIVNRGETDHDTIATLRIEADVAHVVPPAVAALQREIEGAAEPRSHCPVMSSSHTSTFEA